MYKTKQLISLILVLALCLSLGTTAFATEINTAGSSAETPVVLNVEAALFSVTIPTGLPVDVTANGTVTVATDAKIINNSHGPVQVVNMTIEAVEGWTIADYEIDLRNEKVDSNKISMIINELKTTGSDAIEFSTDNFTVMLAKNDDTTDECPIVYNAKVTPLSEAFATDTVANLVLTVDWYKAEGSATETTTSIPVTATDSEGNNLNATSTDIIGTEKDDLLAKLEESGLVTSADEVDALIEVESDDFDNFAETTFDVSSIAQTGDTVVVLHFDETTQQWEYITEATVDAEGKISADFSSFSPVAFVVVKEDGSLGDIEYVNGIAISGTTSCEVGGTSTLTATVDPETATNSEVIWSSMDTSVAKVDASTGVVTGVSSGTTTITATAADGNGAFNSVEFTVSVSGVLAIYSNTDNSLRFYDTTDQVVRGETYNNLAVAEVYTGFETAIYSDSSEVPWVSRKQDVQTVVFEDEISPVSTASWFELFESCTSMDLAKLNTSNVTNMDGMFSSCHALTELDLSSFDTSNVTRMGGMFYSCENLKTIYVSNLWSTSSLENAYDPQMFWGCYSLVGAVAYSDGNGDPAYTGYGMANYLTGYLTFSSGSDPGTSGILAIYSETDNSLRFYNTEDSVVKGGPYNNLIVTEIYTGFDTETYSKAADVPWNEYVNYISNVIVEDEGISPISTAYWFYGVRYCPEMNLSKLETSNVTDMSYMFYKNNNLTTLDLSNFDTSSVTNMTYMFYGCQMLEELDLSNFNTSNVADMSYMFYNCYSWTELNLSSFDTSNVTDMERMFYGNGSLRTIYVSNLWSIANVTNSSVMFYDCTNLVGGNSGLSYDSTKTNAEYANYETGYFTYKANSSNSGSGGTDSGGTDNPDLSVDSTSGAIAVYSADDNSLRFYNTTETVTEGGQYNGLTATAIFADVDTMVTNSETPPSWYSLGSSIQSVIVEDEIQPTMTLGWFAGFSNCTSFDLAKLNISNVTDMTAMFVECASVTTLDLSSFNTSNVQIMAEMFIMCQNLKTIYVSDLWSTNAVTSGDGMFYGCTNLVGATAYNEATIDYTMANYETGYLTYKAAE